MTTRLTDLREADRETLARAATLKRMGLGIFPRGSGQAAHFRRLCKLGLLVFDGMGRDEDCTIDTDVAVYKLTDKGAELAVGL